MAGAAATISTAAAVTARAKTPPFNGDCAREFTLAEYYGYRKLRVRFSTEEGRQAGRVFHRR